MENKVGACTELAQNRTCILGYSCLRCGLITPGRKVVIDNGFLPLLTTLTFLAFSPAAAGLCRACRWWWWWW